MPDYQVERRTVMTYSVVTAANETEARFLARDIWQTDAAIAALAADVKRLPFPVDDTGDARSEARYEETDDDRETEQRERHRKGLQGSLSDPDGIEPW